MAERVIEVPVEQAATRGLAIATALTQLLRSGEEPGEVLEVSRSEEDAIWRVRVKTS